jgi:hypothetical protein
MSIRSAIFFLISLFSGEALSQFVQIGNGNFLGTAGGPLIARNNVANYQSKYAYIFPQNVLGNMKHGDTLTSLSFYRALGDGFTGNCSLQIWLDNTHLDDWGNSPISFNFNTNGATEVYYDHPGTHFGLEGKFYELPFTKPFVFDTTFGKNLSLMVFYEQFDTIKGSVRFYFEGSSSVSGYYSPQVRYSIGTTADDSLRTVTEYHPTIRFAFPREDQDIDVLKLYTLGKLPVPLGNPDSVKVLMRNVGKKDIQALKCYTYTKGPNEQKDSFSVSITKGAEQIFNVPSLSPSNKGTDTVWVQSTDNNNSNNVASSLRWANENIYSYRDISQPPAGGGIGFNGAQGDFVARFQSNEPKNLNQITVAFSGSGRLFKLGIWDYDSIGNKPGKLIWDSDSLTTKGGTYIYDLPKPVKVNGSFYVGVRQLDLNNIAFGYQMEQPVRPKTFFYAVPLGDTNWVDFHPGAPYKFIIEPRLQADFDIVANAVTFPKDTFNVYDNDTVAPVARISNIGVQDITDSVRIRCIIRGPGSVQYDETVFDTIASGHSKSVTFPKTFVPKEFGTHTVTMFVSHFKDQVVDNDTVRQTLVVGCERDAMVRNSFPRGTGTFVARVDTIEPVSTIMNLAFRNSGNFNVVSEIWMGDSLKSRETQTIQLSPLGSQILVWSKYATNDTGTLKWLVFTALQNDEYTLNDTAIFKGTVYKVIDVAPQSILEPDTNTSYVRQQRIDIKTRVYNEGVVRADKIKAIFQIYKPNGTLDYTDSLIRDVNPRNYINYTFSQGYFPQENGEYKTRLYLPDSNDLYRENDTLNSYFTVGKPSDYYTDSISLPEVMSTDPVGVSWSVIIGNLGFDNTLGNAVVSANITRNNVNWFNETQNITCAADETKTLVFTKKFKPMFTGTYQVEVVVNHPKDKNKTNDTVRKTVWVRIGKDALVESIAAPEHQQVYYVNDRVNTTVAYVLNQGNDTLKNVMVHSVWTFEKAIKYQRIDTLQLAPDETVMMVYPVNVTFNQPGKGSFRVWVQHPGDEDPTNDTLIHDYSVRSKRDLVIVAIDSPSVQMPVLTEYKLYPVIKIKNQATDSALLPGNLVVQIVKNGNSWYTERLPIPVLEPGDSTTLQATQVAYFSELGEYQIIAYAEDNIDDNPGNDTLGFTFVVQQNQRNTINVDSKVYPNPTKEAFVTVSNLSDFQQITMFDVVGREIAVKVSKIGEEYTIYWNEDISKGTYFLFINQQKGTRTVRIIVE